MNQIKQIRNTNSYIIQRLTDRIGVSYNTPIVYGKDGITFYTENYYSNTTAHHKSDIIRIFNNCSNIEVTQNALIDLINGDIKSGEVIQEKTNKQLLLSKVLNQSKFNHIAENESFINNTEFIKESKKEYKNGNYLKTRVYKTTFKHIPNFYITFKTRHIKTKITKNNKKYDYYKIKTYKAVISSYL